MGKGFGSSFGGSSPAGGVRESEFVRRASSASKLDTFERNASAALRRARGESSQAEIAAAQWWADRPKRAAKAAAEWEQALAAFDAAGGDMFFDDSFPADNSGFVTTASPVQSRAAGTSPFVQQKGNIHGTSQSKNGPRVPSQGKAASSPLKPQAVSATLAAMERVAMRPAPEKGVRGNLSPDNLRSVGQQIRKAQDTTNTKPAFNVVARQAVNSDTGGAPDCVERPTGNTHGPGRWRGQWFNWCK